VTVHRETLADARATSPLGRASPLAKLAVAVVWLIGLGFTTRPEPPLVLAAVALVGGVFLGRTRLTDLSRALAPLWLIAAVVVATTLVSDAMS
jgi:hypothetical protein